MPPNSDENLSLSTLFPDIAEFFLDSSALDNSDFECGQSSSSVTGSTIHHSKHERSIESTDVSEGPFFKKLRSHHAQCIKAVEKEKLKHQHLQTELKHSRHELGLVYKELNISKEIIKQLVMERAALFLRLEKQKQCSPKKASEKPNSQTGNITLFACATREPVDLESNDEQDDFINVLD